MDEAHTTLLKKYLKGECTPEELQVVKRLLDEEGSKELLDSLMDELYGVQWENPELLEGDTPINEERIKSSLAERVADRASKTKTIPRSNIRMFRSWRNVAVWAGVLLISGLAIMQLKKTPSPGQQLAFIEQTNDSQQPQSHTLPDKSIVHLGAGATIRYKESYGKKDRELSLDGQAFFEVTPDQNRPFTVITNDIHTTVLGTSFKVDAFRGQPLVVAVATGKVVVNHVDKEQNETLATLTPGKKVTWDAAAHKAVESDVEVYGLEQWAAGELVFDEQPLGIAFAEIGKRYSISVSITDAALRNYRVSGTFPADEPLEQVLKILSRSGKFKYTATGKDVYEIRNEK